MKKLLLLCLAAALAQTPTDTLADQALAAASSGNAAGAEKLWRQALEQSESENARLRKIIQLKDEHIRLLNFRIFGPKSEKLSSQSTAG